MVMQRIKFRSSFFTGMLAALALGFIPGIVQSTASAAAYPERPIRFIVPFNAGSNIDGTARILAPKMSELVGQNLVIDNRGGASGTIGASLAAKASSDGYTILMGNAPTHGIAPSVFKNLAYDPVKDFTPIARTTSSSYTLAVSAGLPVKSVAELIAYAKARPGKLNYASTGRGTGVHLAGVMLNNGAGLDIKHIPYNGAAQMLADISSGAVALVFYPYQRLAPLAHANKVLLLATTGAKRASNLPKLPTMLESGIPGFVASSWHGLYAPAGTPKSVVDKLYAAISKTLADPKVVANLGVSGIDVDLLSPREFAAFTKEEVARFGKLVSIAGVEAR